jgi:hypothetical protein
MQVVCGDKKLLKSILYDHRFHVARTVYHRVSPSVFWCEHMFRNDKSDALCASNDKCGCVYRLDKYTRFPVVSGNFPIDKLADDDGEHSVQVNSNSNMVTNGFSFLFFFQIRTTRFTSDMEHSPGHVQYHGCVSHGT